MVTTKVSGQVAARAVLSDICLDNPAALLDKPHIEGPSQIGPTAHRRAQSSLSLRKGKGEFLKLDAAVMRSLFIRLFFRVSTGCVNYRARGCTLSSLCSCRLLRKTRASDSHGTLKNTHKYAKRAQRLRPPEPAQPVSRLLGDIPFLSSTTCSE